MEFKSDSFYYPMNTLKARIRGEEKYIILSYCTLAEHLSAGQADSFCLVKRSKMGVEQDWLQLLNQITNRPFCLCSEYKERIGLLLIVLKSLKCILFARMEMDYLWIDMKWLYHYCCHSIFLYWSYKKFYLLLPLIKTLYNRFPWFGQNYLDF